MSRVQGTPATTDPRVLIFSPFSGIWPHALQEAQVARQLVDEGLRVSYLSCGALFPKFCTVFESRSIPLKGATVGAKRTCVDCQQAAVQIGRALAPSVPSRLLVSFSSPQDGCEADSFLETLTPRNYLEAEFHGLPLGRIASYETLIKYKKITVELAPGEWEYYRESARNSVLTALAANRYLAEHPAERVLCYSPQYGVTGTFAEIALRRGVQVYFVEGSANLGEKYSAVRIWDWQKYKLFNPALLSWPKASQDFVLNDSDRARVSNHFRTIAAAKSHDVYSRPELGKSARERFRIPQGAPLLLLAMSSYDEVFSGAAIKGYPRERYESTVFMSQVEWVQATIEWLHANPDVYIIFRLHPRDFPNAREDRQAEQTMAWDNLFCNLPPNARLDHPSEAFSIYDHLAEVDGLVTGWSSTALEAMNRGIPVVTYDANLPRFPSSIHMTGGSREEYFLNLRTLATTPRDLAIREHALRWLAFAHSRGAVRLPGRSIDTNFFRRFPRVQRLLARAERLAPRFTRRIDLLRKHPAPDATALANLVRRGAKSFYEE